MKLSIYICSILLFISLFQGCGSADSQSETQTNQEAPPRAEITNKEELNSALQLLADNAQSKEEFSKDGLEMVVEYVVNDYLEYVPFVHGYFIEDKDWGDNEDQYFYEMLYASSESLITYMDNLYTSMSASSITNSPTRSFSRVSSYTTTSEVEAQSLLDEIVNIILEILKEMVTSFSFLFGDDKQDVVIPPVSSIYTIDPNQAFSFESLDIEGKAYYVASEQYMTIIFEADGLNGFGDIGYGIGADFTSYIANEKLFIDMQGLYELEMIYKDPGYCLVTLMTDTSDGSQYPAYWFVDEATYDMANNLSTAESLCYIHSTEFETKVIATDGILEPIQDIRVGHTPVSTASTSTMVSELVDGVGRTATMIDAKYFARKMRHGIFEIYTTNEQTHTLQATESEKVSRELLPLAASSAIEFEKLMSAAYDSSFTFQDEVNRDLNSSVSEVSARMDEIITATSQAMDRTTSANGYHGISEPTSYGDIVDFEATNIESACGLAFFICNEATADVTMSITNPRSNGKNADVKFSTSITTSILGDSDIDYSEVDAAQSDNYIGADDYQLNISNFNYNRSNGLMLIKGDGYLGSDSRLEIRSYEVLATFSEQPELTLLNFSAVMDGIITTPSSRVFDGKLVFDGENTSNSQMDGTLVGINEEPTIVGVIKTSLNVQDITSWVSTHDDVLLEDAGDLDNIGSQSYSMEVTITKDNKTVSADMLVKRDVSADTWTYLMNNLLVHDANLNMSIDSLYLIQNGDNTLVATLEKLAMDGLSLDSDINTLINVGWDIASDFAKIGIAGLQVTMKPTSGDVDIQTTIHVLNSGSVMSADMNTSYDYATTHLTANGDFSTSVDSSLGENIYTNSFTMGGVIKVDNKFDYLYSLEYTQYAQDMLFTSRNSSYQMGFRISDGTILGGDSYGILATFIMNDTYDILENMQLRNDDNNPLGIYNRSEDTLKIKFSDSTQEYMYLY